jgi:Glycine zipper
LGEGTANGEVRLQTRANGRLRLDGTLKPEGIDTAQAVIAFNRRAVLAGKASGSTTLSADGDTPAELAQSLHTTSTLRVSRARLLRFDLEKAVRSAGREHTGQTPLDSLTAQMDTQNTAQGMVITFTNVKATSGALTATGKGRLANQAVEAELAVDLVSGLVGVPLTISGPVSAVKVGVPAGAVAGAAVGTAVLPGIGTAIGARIGATLGNIFGGKPAAAPGSKPPASAPAKR